MVEAAALGLAWLLWAGGVLSGPGFAASDNTGSQAAVIVFELSAALVTLAVPAWLVRRTGLKAWWVLGAVPTVAALVTAIVILGDF